MWMYRHVCRFYLAVTLLCHAAAGGARPENSTEPNTQHLAQDVLTQGHSRQAGALIATATNTRTSLDLAAHEDKAPNITISSTLDLSESTQQPTIRPEKQKPSDASNIGDSATQSDLPPQHSVQLSDLVVALPSAQSRLVMVHASRVWRRGLRTVITADTEKAGNHTHTAMQETQSFNETFVIFPDEVEDPETHRLKARYPGDQRFGMTPALAHR